MAYYISGTTICLFSPQTYCIKNTDTALLSLSSNGIALTLAYGQILHFPYQDWSNLPIMLTTAAIDSASPKSSLSSKASDHKPSANLLHTVASFVSSTYFKRVFCLIQFVFGIQSLIFFLPQVLIPTFSALTTSILPELKRRCSCGIVNLVILTWPESNIYYQSQRPLSNWNLNCNLYIHQTTRLLTVLYRCTLLTNLQNKNV